MSDPEKMSASDKKSATDQVGRSAQASRSDQRPPSRRAPQDAAAETSRSARETPTPLDAAAPSIALRRPLRWGPGAPALLLELTPLGELDAAPELSVGLTHLETPPGAAIEAADHRPLIGFIDPRGGSVAGIDAPLLRSVTLSQRMPVARLALDPQGLLAAVQATDAAAAAAVETLLAEIALRQRGGGLRAPFSARHRVRFELVREPWPVGALRVDLSAHLDRKRLGRVDPPSVAAPELPAIYPVARARQTAIGIADVSVTASDVSPMATPTLARLDAAVLGVSDPDLAAALQFQDEDGRPNDEILLHSVGGRFQARRTLMLLCGRDGGLAEPERLLDREIQLSLREIGDAAENSGSGEAQGGLMLAQSAPHVLRVLPPMDPARLELRAADGDKTLAEIAFADAPTGGATQLPLRELRGRAAGGLEDDAPTALLMAIEATLFGRPPQQAATRLSAEAAFLDHDGSRIRGIDALRARISYRQDDGGSDTRAALSPQSRSATIEIAVPSARRAYQAALGEAFDPNRALGLEVTLRAEGAVAGTAILRRAFTIGSGGPRWRLAIDFGAAGLTVARRVDGQAPEIARLLDPTASERAEGAARGSETETNTGRETEPAMDAATSEIVSTAIDLAPEGCWRAERYPESLWSAVPDAHFAVEPHAAAQALDRAYPIALPAAGSEAKETCLLDALGQIEPGLAQRLPRLAGANGTGEQAVSVERALGDALHEIADFHLARAGWLANGPPTALALVHPTRFGAAERARFKAAAAALAARLGLSVDDPAQVILVPAADAAAAHFFDRLPVDARPTVRALSCDLGAGGLGVALVEIDRAAPGFSGGGARRTVARGGAALGADAIDAVLYFTVHAVLRRLDADAPAFYARDLTAPIGSDDPAAPSRRAKRLLARAIEAAKADLSDRCRAATSGKGERYRWPEEIPFEIQVGEVGGLADAWPVRGRPGETLGAEAWPIAGGAALYRRGQAILLRLSKAAVERPAMTSLMRFLGETAVRRVAAEATREDPTWIADELFVAGRGALWPLFVETLDKLVGVDGLAARWGFTQPADVLSAKTGAALGALALIDAPGTLAPRPARYALLASEIGHDGVERPRRLAPEAAFPDWAGYAGRLRLVEAPAGVDAPLLDADPWAISLLSPTGIGDDATALGLTQDHGPPRLDRRDAAKVSLRIGDVEISADRTWFRRPAALHRAQFDVTEIDAPPGYPASTAPEEQQGEAV